MAAEGCVNVPVRFPLITFQRSDFHSAGDCGIFLATIPRRDGVGKF